MQVETLKITGMNSDQCAVNVNGVLRAIEGVADVSVSLLGSQAQVLFNEKNVNLSALQEALAQAGFGSAVATKAKDQGSCCGGCCS